MFLLSVIMSKIQIKKNKRTHAYIHIGVFSPYRVVGTDLVLSVEIVNLEASETLNKMQKNQIISQP